MSDHRGLVQRQRLELERDLGEGKSEQLQLCVRSVADFASRLDKIDRHLLAQQQLILGLHRSW